jgi:hypothetical protein
VLDAPGQGELRVDEGKAGRAEALAYLEAGQGHQGERTRLQTVQVAHRDLAVAPHRTESTGNINNRSVITSVFFSNVADLGYLSRILAFIYPGSRIPDTGPKNSNKREGGKNLFSYLFCGEEKNLGQINTEF